MEHPFQARLAHRILLTRCSFPMSQEELARKVGASRQTINAIKGGRQIPSLFLALKLAEVLGVKLDDLFFFLKKK